ncbi:MAG: hypothetical protein GXX85_14395 [Ignavibacteria bacterium]|jgi:CRISPR/Cas system type I-B associated protein Csh2 (Cas7 group RAMP superfamily)|nr:hypothetical protein [Ignavibacteria bacterium]
MNNEKNEMFKDNDSTFIFTPEEIEEHFKNYKDYLEKQKKLKNISADLSDIANRPPEITISFEELKAKFEKSVANWIPFSKRNGLTK